MTHISSHEGKSHEELELMEFEAELGASSDRVLGIIEVARSKMTENERKAADEKADAILKSATGSAAPSRRRA